MDLFTLKRLTFIKTVKCKLCPAVHFAAKLLIVIIIISERSALSINERNTCVQVKLLYLSEGEGKISVLIFHC